MFQQAISPATRPAVVSKSAAGREAQGQYLLLGAADAPVWVNDPAKATAFPCMKDAMRAALRLPSGLRAFGLPLEVELDAFQAERLH